MEPSQQSSPPKIPPRLQRYSSAFQRLSARTGTPITSLVVSFAILHEVTALVPLVGVYWGARTFGIGERMTKYISEAALKPSTGENAPGEDERTNEGMFQETLARWTKEGETRVARVGSRYGILGFEKGQKVKEEDLKVLGQNISREVVNATFAYIVVKSINLRFYLSSSPNLPKASLGAHRNAAFFSSTAVTQSQKLRKDDHHIVTSPSGEASLSPNTWDQGRRPLIVVPQLPKDYKVVLLKNEFGDVEVDSQLAKQSSLSAVSEILNGCMCCILVGQMKTALLEIHQTFSPNRIIIETSGSAFPAALAFQIRELERETNGSFKLDAIVTVIDAENFTGYEDTSVTAKMQAAYTDILLINKWELVSERQLDIVMDHLFTLNESTPKIKCNGKSGVDPSLIFGLDTKLFQMSSIEEEKRQWINGTLNHHREEVEVVTLQRGTDQQPPIKEHVHDEHCKHPTLHLDKEEGLSTRGATEVLTPLTKEELESALNQLPKEGIYRVKGFIKLKVGIESSPVHILNWAFGRFELTTMEGKAADGVLNARRDLLFTVMGEAGEVRSKVREFAAALHASLVP
ncbi:hypothetical protein FRC17_011234 [Serendipita sp. 399]|nr:hypothetical protein FRC17_011234 [Serendipita sp. 399]